MDNETGFNRRDFVKKGVMGGVFFAGGAAVAKAGGVSVSPDAIQVPRLLVDDRVVRIPEDYPTLQEAIDRESRWFPVQGKRILLRIQSGHRLTAGLLIQDGHFAHFRIESEDTVVEVSDDFEGDLINGRRCHMPTLACLIDMRDRGRNGYFVRNSIGYIEPKCGVRNAGRDCVLCDHAGMLEMREAEATGAGRFNLHCAVSAMIGARSAILSGSKHINVYCSHTGSITCDSADCSGAAEDGVWANGASQIDAASVDARDCGGHGIRSHRGASVRARDADVSGAGGRGLEVRDGGIIAATGTRTTHGTPAVQDTNLANFNQVFGQGIIFNENA